MNLSRALRVQRGDLIALVGAGGKTSAMFRLAEELAAQGWSVVMTTSTHLGAGQVAAAPHAVILPAGEIERVSIGVPSRSPTLLVGEIDPSTNKAGGLSLEAIDRIAATPGLDLLINEADGARSLPFKAPAAHEPAVSPGTTLAVLVVGIDALGQPLDGAHVHRPERVVALTGAEMGAPVSVETIAAALTHAQGGLKGLPARGRVVALVNKVSTTGEEALARRLAGRLLGTPRIDAVAVGAIQEWDPIRCVQGRVAAVVLAAGESRRFGRFKQLHPWGAGTLLTRAVDVALASQAGPVLVVLGHQAEACRAALGDRPVKIVVNPRWAEGQSTSMQAGLAALPPNVGAVLFHLVDQPRVTSAVLDRLIERHARTLAPVVWPEYQGRRGNPVLFDRRAFAALQRVRGDTGGRPILLAYEREGVAERVAVDEPGILLDIDTPEDLATGEPGRMANREP